MSEKLSPESDCSPSLAQRFTTFVDQYLQDAIPDEINCRTQLLALRDGLQGDRLIVARHETDPDVPSWHLTLTASDIMDANAMTLIYEAGEFSMLTGFTTDGNNAEVIVDALLLSYEDSAAKGFIVPIDTSTS